MKISYFDRIYISYFKRNAMLSYAMFTQCASQPSVDKYYLFLGLSLIF